MNAHPEAPSLGNSGHDVCIVLELESLRLLATPNHEATMPEARYTLYKVLDRALVGLLILVVLVLLGLQVSHAG